MSEIKTEYTVKKGDTLGKIAMQNNTTVTELERINNIDNVNFIKIGQKIKLLSKAKLGELKDDINLGKNIPNNIKGLTSSYNNLSIGNNGEKSPNVIGVLKKDGNGKWTEEDSGIPFYLTDDDFLRLHGGEEAVITGEKRRNDFVASYERFGKQTENTTQFKELVRRNEVFVKKERINIAWVQTTIFEDLKIYSSDLITGKFDFNTLAAIATFQKSHGLKGNGVIDPETLKRIFTSSNNNLLARYNYNEVIDTYGINNNPSIKITGFNDNETPGYKSVADALYNLPNVSGLTKNENGRYYTQRNGIIEDGNIRYGNPYIDTIIGSDGKITYGWFQKGSEVIKKNGDSISYMVDSGRRRIG